MIVKPTFPKWDGFSSTLSLRCARIKPLGHGLPWFGHLMRDLIAISGLEGRFGPAFGLVDTHLVRPVKPRSLVFADNAVMLKPVARGARGSPSVCGGKGHR
jgi:hypothetical protein